MAMTRRLTENGPVRSLAAAALVLALAITSRALDVTTHAQGAQQLVPVAASSVARRPADFYGSRVALSASVDRILSPTAFVVDQDPTRSTDEAVLVVAPTLTEAPEPNAYVTVIGELVAFDPDEVARRLGEYRLDLAPDAIAAFRGRPMVLATAVIDAALVDLAKVPDSPLSPEEQAFDQTMKEVSAAFPALRTAIDSANPDVTEEFAAVLRESFGQAVTFFKGRGTADATGWAEEAQKFVQSISAAADAGRWGDAATAAASLGQLCQTCHAAHRERMDDGSYRVRKDR